MDIHERRRERLQLLLKEISAAELSRRSGIAASLLSRYLYEPGRAGAKNLGEENARKIESAAKKSPGWLDRSRSGAGVEIPPVAHLVSHALQMIDPITIPWGAILSMELPDRFMLEVRDDAMVGPDAASLEPGHFAIFETKRAPRPGRNVLIADRDGNLYIREYQVRTPTHWQGVAKNPAYQPLDSVANGLRIVATQTGHHY